MSQGESFGDPLTQSFSSSVPSDGYYSDSDTDENPAMYPIQIGFFSHSLPSSGSESGHQFATFSSISNSSAFNEIQPHDSNNQVVSPIRPIDHSGQEHTSSSLVEQKIQVNVSTSANPSGSSTLATSVAAPQYISLSPPETTMGSPNTNFFSSGYTTSPSFAAHRGHSLVSISPFMSQHFGNPVPLPDLTGASPAATPQTVLFVSPPRTQDTFSNISQSPTPGAQTPRQYFLQYSGISSTTTGTSAPQPSQPIPRPNSMNLTTKTEHPQTSEQFPSLSSILSPPTNGFPEEEQNQNQMSVPKLNSKSKAFVPRWKMSGSSSETPATSTPPVPLHPPTGALFSKAPTFRPKQAKIQISPQNARANHPIDLTQPLFVHPQQQYPPIGVHSSTLVPPSQTSPSSQTQKQFSSPKSGNDGIGSTAATILEYIRNETSFSQSQINTFQRPFAPSHNQNNPYFPRASESSITLVSCYGTFLELAEDMLGARFLQSRLAEASESEITQVFIELTTGKRTIIQLMTHSYANYVVQKLFEVCSDEQVLVLFDAIRGHFSALSFDTFGCRVMQCAIPRMPESVCSEISSELFHNCLKAIHNQNSNHVLQKSIEFSSHAALTLVADAITQHGIHEIATHAYGCRVIQRLLECDDSAMLVRLGSILIPHVQSLVLNQYGNFVVQHLVQNARNELVTFPVKSGNGGPNSTDTTITLNLAEAVVKTLQGTYFALSVHKFGSNVVEKCLEYSSDNFKMLIISEIMNTSPQGLARTPKPNVLTEALYSTNTARGPLSISPSIGSFVNPTTPFTTHPLLYLMMDQFGNYVSQRICDISPFPIKDGLISQLICVLPIRSLRGRRDWLRKRDDMCRSNPQFSHIQDDQIEVPPKDFVSVRIEKMLKSLERPDPVRFPEPPRIKQGKDRARRALEDRKWIEQMNLRKQMEVSLPQERPKPMNNTNLSSPPTNDAFSNPTPRRVWGETNTHQFQIGNGGELIEKSIDGAITILPNSAFLNSAVEKEELSESDARPGKPKSVEPTKRAKRTRTDPHRRLRLDGDESSEDDHHPQPAKSQSSATTSTHPQSLSSDESQHAPSVKFSRKKVSRSNSRSASHSQSNRTTPVSPFLDDTLITERSSPPNLPNPQFPPATWNPTAAEFRADWEEKSSISSAHFSHSGIPASSDNMSAFSTPNSFSLPPPLPGQHSTSTPLGIVPHLSSSLSPRSALYLTQTPPNQSENESPFLSAPFSDIILPTTTRGLVRSAKTQNNTPLSNSFNYAIPSHSTRTTPSSSGRSDTDRMDTYLAPSQSASHQPFDSFHALSFEEDDDKSKLSEVNFDDIGFEGPNNHLPPDLLPLSLTSFHQSSQSDSSMPHMDSFQFYPPNTIHSQHSNLHSSAPYSSTPDSQHSLSFNSYQSGRSIHGMSSHLDYHNTQPHVLSSTPSSSMVASAETHTHQLGFVISGHSLTPYQSFDFESNSMQLPDPRPFSSLTSVEKSYPQSDIWNQFSSTPPR